jgi:hypothetical protein
MRGGRFPGRVVRAIIAKDLKDVLRDGRIVIGVVFVVGAALLLGLTSPNDQRTKATLIYWADGESRLPETMKTLGRDVIDLRIKRADSPGSLRDVVSNKAADVAMIIPRGFDTALRGGQDPSATVIIADPPSGGGAAIAATIEPALRTLTGQEVPATVETQTVRAAFRRGEAAVNEVGLRRYSGLLGILGIIAVVGLFMVPMILAEETEKKTIEALAMAASYRTIVVAKAMVGFVVAAVLTVAAVYLTDVDPVEPSLLAVAFGLTALLFVGAGLLLGGYLSATAVNSWSGLVIIALLVPALLVGNPPPWSGIDSVLDALPTSQAIRLALNGVSGTSLFPGAWVSVLVLLAWLLAIYAVLIRRLSSREV